MRTSETSRTRKQEWTLTQTGNWALDKLDLNGDADWSDTDEWQDSKTFNKVNEIGTRDLDATPGTTGDNYTLAYDPAGNMTNDGTDYKYEWDAFYRLRKVKTQGGALVAEYRYNGLGYRTGVLEDTNASGTTLTDGSDLWYYSAYDERWRMVATYRSSDTDPKERFVHQQAGDGGFGGSSYIDLVAFREKDANTAWTAASDGTLEERLYYCQNQHADVVALITAGGGQREMDRYSAYGVPFGLPMGDSNSDGLANASDRSIIQGWINANTYDVRGDVDLDGDVEGDDKTDVQSAGAVTLGRNALSTSVVRNRLGSAGYSTLTTSSSGHVGQRWRTLLTPIGMWTSRDREASEPHLIRLSANVEYLYRYGTGNPAAESDPTGKDVGEGGFRAGCALAGIPCPPEFPGVKYQGPGLLGVMNAARGFAMARAASGSEQESYLRHCHAACETCRIAGGWIALTAGLAVEAWEDISDPENNTDDEADADANQAGVDCCRAGLPCERCCEESWAWFVSARNMQAALQQMYSSSAR